MKRSGAGKEIELKDASYRISVMWLRKYKFTILVVIVCGIFATIIYSKARINASYFVFLPGYRSGASVEEIDNEELRAFFKIVQKFNDGSQFVVVLHHPEGFFSPQVLSRAVELQERLSSLPCMKNLLSVINYSFRKPYFDGSTLNEAILEDPEASSFVSKDGKYLLLYCTLSVDCDEDEALKAIEKVLGDFKDLKALSFGQIVINRHLFREIIRQVFVYPGIIFLVILFIFYLQTRSLKASFVSLTIPVLANVIVYGVVSLLGVELNTLSVMSVSFLIIIGSAYGLHFYNGVVRFGERVRKEMLTPIFFSMFTTSVGFLSFLFVEIAAFRHLGLMVSSGLALVFVILFSSGYELLRSEKPIKRGTLLLRLRSENLGQIMLVFSLVCAALTFLLLPRIEVGMDQAAYFSKSSAIGQALTILTEKFSYREPVYVMVEKQSLFNVKDSQRISELVEDLRRIDGVSSVQFPTAYPIPSLVLMSRLQPAIHQFVADGRTIRIVVNLTEEGYRKAAQLKDRLRAVLEKYPEYTFTVASAAFVVEQINTRIVASQVQSLTISLLLIFGSVLFAFRNLLLSLLIVVPIVLTALLNFFFMGLFGLRLEIATSIVASILVGLVVDYSIHLAHDMRRTKDVFRSIENISMPVLANGLGLIGGFSVLMFSKLALFRNVSLLLMLGIGFGVAFTLFSQPLLIKRFARSDAVSVYKDRQRSK
ncbi:MMPL family transporter [Pseudothermotoga sp.]|uniref:efflux RND transporter permease subunit n=1 Tax=Pseudothermotoga sp. TaxID=2033661 RepID=UPI000A57AC25